MTSAALAQQTELPPRAQQQPFGQAPPPPIDPRQQQRQAVGDPQHPPPLRELFRGLVAVDGVPLDQPAEIDEPVTGYGNDLFWDAPQAPQRHARLNSVAASR